MASERDRCPRRFAMEPQAEASKHARFTPDRNTLTELLDPVEVACVFDTQLEIAVRQLVALEAANHAGDHYGSAVAASGLRTALILAGTAIIRMRAKSQGHAATLSRRLIGAFEAARPALEQAFTPSIAAKLEIIAGSGRTQWDLEVARWRDARGRSGLETTSDMSAPESESSISAELALVHAINRD